MNGDKYRSSGCGYEILMAFLGSGIGGFIGHQFDKLHDALEQLNLSNLEQTLSQTSEEPFTPVYTIIGLLAGLVLSMVISHPFAKILYGVGDIIDGQQEQIDTLDQRVAKLSDEIFKNMEIMNNNIKIIKKHVKTESTPDSDVQSHEPKPETQLSETDPNEAEKSETEPTE
ncbi:MAG: hypothetical protein IJ060_06570 [Oscillospiraceae bacterium]|nr:hypothetical protein [Oscillospiraceae bacterium]